MKLKTKKKERAEGSVARGYGGQFNPITYGILTFRQLRGGGLFWPGSRKQG